MTTISLDFESGSPSPLVGKASVGLHNYMNDLETKPFMLAYTFDDDIRSIKHVDFTAGEPIPAEFREAMLDPEVERWAFNSQFERVMTKTVLGIDTPIKGWRCTMALAYMRGFKGGLDEVGEQLGLPFDKLKDADGKRLIKMFCQPQRVTKNQPLLWRDRNTDPEDWSRFVDYNIQDVVTEISVKKLVFPLPTLASEWELYEIDQAINDAGMPVNRRFVENAWAMVQRRKVELFHEMRELTGLKNPNSNAQILPWLQDRGYRWHDMQKLTVEKSLLEHKELVYPMDETAVKALKLRQQASRTSVQKYPAILRRLAADDTLKYCFQFNGASRTKRWSGRGPQPQNLVRTPSFLKEEDILVPVSDAIEEGDYEILSMLVAEPMSALAGLLRSAFQATEEGTQILVADLSSIESAVIGWLSQCPRLLNVFRDGRDPYKDFATEFYKVAYDLVTKAQRNVCKIPVLGAGYGMGGGREIDMKKTGLWGYADSMGVKISQEIALALVKLFRSIYPEIPATWKLCERAAERACRGLETTVNGLLHFSKVKDYVTIEKPSGDHIFYHKPMMKSITTPGKNGEPWTRNVFTAMGTMVGGNTWRRVAFSGPKLIENSTQSVARDVFGDGVRALYNDGFDVRGLVHDENVMIANIGDNYYTLDRAIELMTTCSPWTAKMGQLPLGAAGFTGRIYRKD